jgi:hypothetical protein
MCGAIPPFSQYAFMAWYLLKHRDNFTFTFTLPYIENLAYTAKKFPAWAMMTFFLFAAASRPAGA